ncbi:MAG TPA: hypothetical protein DCW68_07205 [Rhodospirillaceae bacterium]|nr:MAG: hypothetical protein A2018_06710 [Alphaproteobacteria bacterium GWF2_58_20]HAU29874.1 hypothetical protein [Rhodospirillaceae bacterium]
MNAIETRLEALETKVAALEAKVCACEESGKAHDCQCKDVHIDTSAWQAKLFGWVNNNPILAAFIGLLVLLVLSKIFN